MTKCWKLTLNDYALYKGIIALHDVVLIMNRDIGFSKFFFEKKDVT